MNLVEIYNTNENNWIPTQKISRWELIKENQIDPYALCLNTIESRSMFRNLQKDILMIELDHLTIEEIKKIHDSISRDKKINNLNLNSEKIKVVVTGHIIKTRHDLDLTIYPDENTTHSCTIKICCESYHILNNETQEVYS